ncbi:thioredoxin [Candidatus Pacearchaeota archaeon]|nr:MAG: thioredoxin [Candidatus Pacearchaeota archaeon]
MAGKVKELSAENFDEFIKEGIAVVDFWAAWCGPCRMMSPIFEKAAETLSSQANFGKLNVDEFPEIAQRFQIMSIPTIAFFKDGQLEDMLIGVSPESELKAKISELSSR